MRYLRHLFEKNWRWAEQVRSQEPEFFANLSRQQSPEYLWIGCSDSRVPANQIVGLKPGEVFVHRNVANVVVHTDLNCLSVIQYAVDVLRVRHVIVCGHYGCGGVQSALRNERLGLIDNWLRHVQDVRAKHAPRLEDLGPGAASDFLCELNVVEQAANVAQTTVLQEAWERGQRVVIHAWIYGIEDGRLRDLDFTVNAAADVAPSYDDALRRLVAAKPDRGGEHVWNVTT